MNDKNAEMAKLIHDARNPLNNISMNAELVKLILENDMPKDKAIDALKNIISACQDCSKKLQSISEHVSG